MSRNLTSRYLRETELALTRAVAISDVTRIARVACGYRVTTRATALVARPCTRSWATFSDDERTSVTFTASDRAWFRKPLTDGAL